MYKGMKIFTLRNYINFDCCNAGNYEQRFNIKDRTYIILKEMKISTSGF